MALPTFSILTGDVLTQLAGLPSASVQTCVTSPPYWGLRDYGTCDCGSGRYTEGQGDGTGGPMNYRASKHDPDCPKCSGTGKMSHANDQLGLESTPEEYVANMVEVFREVRRVLRDDGTLWLNLGDSYTSGNRSNHGPSKPDKNIVLHNAWRPPQPQKLKPKDLVGIPWRVAFALQADGWYLRSDIIWCLSGGTKVYARTQKGEMPTTIKDLVRLDPSTVQLWNGEKWTQVLGWNESERGEPLEIELRSGERIGCTSGHVWPTRRGNVRADELEVGDVIESTTLPEPAEPYSPDHVGPDVAWLLGLYLAEGSRDNRGRIQLAGHADQTPYRLDAIRPVAEAFGGTARAYEDGNTGNIVVDCPPLEAVVGQYIHGRTAKTKGIKARAWRHDNEWLVALINGYLHGDGHHDADNGRWRLGFTRNDRLADDLRTLCARLGYRLTLKATTGTGYGKTRPIYRGEIRRVNSGHHNERARCTVLAIRRSRARKFYDIGVADEPHTFALASGVLTHNSKPNPMPESVTDRPTKAHEYVFLLSKSARYHYDADAIAEDSLHAGRVVEYDGTQKNADVDPSLQRTRIGGPSGSQSVTVGATRNKRTVWTITTKPYREAHFATFPPELPETCIKAGTSAKGCCPECGAPWERKRKTNEWLPKCNCECDPVPCTVLDIFSGAGTTGLVSLRLGCNYIGIELNPEYAEMSRKRIRTDADAGNRPNPRALLAQLLYQKEG